MKPWRVRGTLRARRLHLHSPAYSFLCFLNFLFVFLYKCFLMFLIYRPSPYSQSRCGVLIQEGFTIETGANSARVGQYPPASH